jgi:hypothetical protein
VVLGFELKSLMIAGQAFLPLESLFQSKKTDASIEENRKKDGYNSKWYV